MYVNDLPTSMSASLRQRKMNDEKYHDGIISN